MKTRVLLMFVRKGTAELPPMSLAAHQKVGKQRLPATWNRAYQETSHSDQVEWNGSLLISISASKVMFTPLLESWTEHAC